MYTHIRSFIDKQGAPHPSLSCAGAMHEPPDGVSRINRLTPSNTLVQALRLVPRRERIDSRHLLVRPFCIARSEKFPLFAGANF